MLPPRVPMPNVPSARKGSVIAQAARKGSTMLAAGVSSMIGRAPSSKAAEAAAKNTNLTWSGGLIANATGELTSVTWDSPAFAAGMTVADQIVAIDGDAWSADRLKAAITAAKGTKEPIQLTVKRGDSYRSVALDYHGGLRYPRLEKIGTGDSGLDRLLAAR